ncbi:MAG: PASTA domain-containing protein [Clostridiales Family XIII bacterium]|jgi:stage V sporulation protein D (sporulation-specific penicillin-binding protein)|nr:PASTA domain-containing protein [Clostridiales Family XIII bacterium]
MIIAFGVIVLLFCVLAFNTGYIQVINTEVYASKALEAQTSDDVITAKRGEIYDKNGSTMATSSTTYRVWIRLKPDHEKLALSEEEETRQEEATIALLKDVLGLDESTLRAQIALDQKRVRVAKGVFRDQRESMLERIATEKITIIEFEDEYTRNYPLGASAAHILGSVSNDGYGQAGIERQYDSYLSGIAGRRVESTNSKGDELSNSKGRKYVAKDGLNVVTTIDETIQYYVESAIATVMEATQAKKVTAVVMDPKTGDILAMAKNPSYDPNNPGMPYIEEDKEAFLGMPPEEQSAYLSEMWRNPAISDVYDPGSPFKLITLSSALETGSVTLNDHVYCAGSYSVGGFSIGCWYRPNAHGDQTVKQAIGNSCNPGLIQIGQRMGFDNFFNYIELFGLTRTTNIDLPDEASSIYHAPDVAGPADLANMTFGQSISITPIELITAVSAIGNEGKLMKPRIVSKLVDDDGNTVKEFEPQVVRQVISKQTSDEVREVMQYVVDEAGGQVAKIPGYDIGGKTGTAQKVVNGAFSRDKVVGSMITMAPMSDPQFTVLVVVDEPTIGSFGSTTAGPGVREITENILKYLNVKPNYSEKEAKALQVGTKTVPDVNGKVLSEASGIMLAQGINYSIQGAGTATEVVPGSPEDKLIVDQYPKAGNNLSEGDTVFLYLQ